MNARELIPALSRVSDGEVSTSDFMPICCYFLPRRVEVTLHIRERMFWLANPGKAICISDIANAGSEPITLPPGSSVFDLSFSLGMMRGGHLDTTILGALEVDQEGNIANWAANRKGHWWPGIGGAMDLTWVCKKVVATLQHCDNKGNSKILKKCSCATGVKCEIPCNWESSFWSNWQGLVQKKCSWCTETKLKQITEADFTLAPDVPYIKL